MNIWNGILVRTKQHEIMEFLYRFRGATNEQLRRKFYGSYESKRSTQLANTSKFVSQLKKDGLVKSASCHPYRPGEINFLTKKGIEYIHDNLQIEQNPTAITGFGKDVGSFSYDILKPPLQYLEHHLMLVDVVVDYSKKGYYRNGLYAVREYTELIDVGRYGYEKKHKLRPDAELHHKGAIVAIEIDTGSERHDQLVEKFANYKRYFDYCLKNKLDNPLSLILFHTKRGNEAIPLENDTRWITIFKAAVEGFSYHCWDTPIMGFNRSPLSALLKEEQGRLDTLGIPIPPRENPIKLELQQQEEQERLRKEKEARLAREAEQKRKQIEEQRRLEVARRKRMEEERQEKIRLEEERKNKSFMRKLFG